MQSPLMDASRTLFKIPNTHSLGFLPSSSNLPPTTLRHRIYCKFSNPNNNRRRNSLTSAKGKDNVWSVDNDAANGSRSGGVRRRKGRKKVKSSVAGRRRKGGSDDGVMVSGSMLIETENVLQTQEPVIIPIWNTFASSVSGIWKGVGAVFSPITAQMEPIEVGRNNEHQFDCYTLSRIEAVPPANRDDKSHIRRTVNWVTLNPYGENRQLHSRENKGKEMSVDEDASLTTIDSLDGKRKNHVLPKFESFDFEASDVMEEDLMGMQHISMSRDLEIGMVNASSPWGNHHLIPFGPLREPLTAFSRADAAVIHHADMVPDQSLSAIESTILEKNRFLPVYRSAMTPSHFFKAPNVSSPLALGFYLTR